MKILYWALLICIVMGCANTIQEDPDSAKEYFGEYELKKVSSEQRSIDRKKYENGIWFCIFHDDTTFEILKKCDKKELMVIRYPVSPVREMGKGSRILNNMKPNDTVTVIFRERIKEIDGIIWLQRGNIEVRTNNTLN